MTSTYVRDQKRVQVLDDGFDNDDVHDESNEEEEEDDHGEDDDNEASRKLLSLIFSPGVMWGGNIYGSISPGREKWSKCGIFFIFLELCCDQKV